MFNFSSVAGQGGHSRGEGVEATRSHFQHPILPVLPGHSEVVHGTPEDAEGHPLQQELGVLCLQAQGPPPQPQRGQLTPVKPGREKEMCEQPVLGKECVLLIPAHPAGPALTFLLLKRATLLVIQRIRIVQNLDLNSFHWLLPP